MDCVAGAVFAAYSVSITCTTKDAIPQEVNAQKIFQNLMILLLDKADSQDERDNVM